MIRKSILSDNYKHYGYNTSQYYKGFSQDASQARMVHRTYE